MRGLWLRRGIKFAGFALVGITALTWIVVGLWNWLMPALFGVNQIHFWQALGLLVLTRILFGGFRGRPGGHRNVWRERMRKRWQTMTPEEQQQFRSGVRGCGWWGHEFGTRGKGEAAVNS
jgi:hypothetical protein